MAQRRRTSSTPDAYWPQRQGVPCALTAARRLQGALLPKFPPFFRGDRLLAQLGSNELLKQRADHDLPAGLRGALVQVLVVERVSLEGRVPQQLVLVLQS